MKNANSSAEMTDAERELHTVCCVRIPYSYIHQGIDYADNALDIYRAQKNPSTLKASRVVNAFRANVNSTYIKFNASGNRAMDLELAEEFEDRMADLYGKLYRACQNGVRQHHVGDLDENTEIARTFAACAHALIAEAVWWMQTYDRRLQKGGSYTVSNDVLQYQTALKQMAGGDYESKDNQVSTAIKCIRNKWLTVLTYFENKAKQSKNENQI